MVSASNATTGSAERSDDSFAAAYMADCRGLVLKELRAIVPASPRFKSILYDLMLDYPERSAKALRPALCIATCRALGGPLGGVLQSAAVLELYHNAFLIHVDGHIAGFALVDPKSRLTDSDEVHDVAEFFVLRKYRRKRIGEQAACILFATFPGPWEVRQRMENTAATAFWRAAIGRFTKGRFVELMWEDKRWRGPVQRFDSVTSS